MKKIITIIIVFISTYSTNSQSIYYGRYNDLIENPQSKILKEKKAKSVIVKHYENPETSGNHLHDYIYKIDSTGNISEKKFTSYYGDFIKKYYYDKKNILKRKSFSKNNNKYTYSRPQMRILTRSDFNPINFYYKYDDLGRLKEVKSCDSLSNCRIEHKKYFSDRVFTFFKDVEGNLIKRKIFERKDSLEIELEINKLNEIEKKTITYFNKDSLETHKDNFEKDTLAYRVINEFDIKNRKIKSVRTQYFKKYKNYVRNASITKEYYIYNQDSSIRTAINKSTDTWRYEYHYNEKGLLIAINTFIDEKLRYLDIYEYNM
ncbi:hypothetical protein [uncultured Lutibacter sp.]|uniref:hypothetical protein n=1 Tax=uncultured Lutibacter sp. TaxID=437739 RepID=UPI0026303EB3|nr:hypothetical protein [uncultured Lutibacter sp.]